jgi:large subunit ribosomal protein L21
MYAVIRDRGRQYSVREGDTFNIDLMTDPGESIDFSDVLLLSGDGDVKVGKPTVEGATVNASVIGLAKGPKLDVLKYRRRKDSKVKTGHRQKYTRIRIEKISAGA